MNWNTSNTVHTTLYMLHRILYIGQALYSAFYVENIAHIIPHILGITNLCTYYTYRILYIFEFTLFFAHTAL